MQLTIPRRAPSALIAATLAMLALGPASARAVEPVTLGPELSKYPDSNMSPCSTNPFSGSPLSAPSCTWTSVSVGASNPLVLFGSGTISQISVKVGASTGMMKAVLMQTTLQLLGEGEAGHVQVSCCTDVGESAPFTPTANSITTVPVDLTDNQAFNLTSSTLVLDYLALSVMEAGVPIPAATGVHESVEGEEGEQNELQPGDLVEAPELLPGQPAREPQKGEGDLLLMDAVFNSTEVPHTPSTVPAGGPGETQPLLPGTSTPTASAKQPKLSFPPAGPHLRIDGTKALLTLDCSKAAACRGTLRLQSAAQIPTAGLLAALGSTTPKSSVKSHLLTYASGRFDIPSGGTQTLRLKLSSAGRKLAREHRRLTVWVNTAPAPTGSGIEAFSDPVNLRF